jgi:hypothetical protein
MLNIVIKIIFLSEIWGSLDKDYEEYYLLDITPCSLKN